MDARTRLVWIRLYDQLGNAGVVCRRCGISRPTLRKWWRRYQANGVAGLKDESRRPHHLAKQKVFAEQEALVLELRRSPRLGIKQLRSELLRQHGLGLSLDTLHRILVRNGEQHLKRPKLRRKGKKRYSRPVPGDRVQLDVCNIVPAVYQYTAIDDCSRYRVLAVYPRRNATYTLDFLERLLEEMPFPIQRIQSDRGLEFFAEKVQRRLMEWAIKFRPIKPRSPHLNGKVENRSGPIWRSSGRPSIHAHPTFGSVSQNGSISGTGSGRTAGSMAKPQSTGSASSWRKSRYAKPSKPTTTPPGNVSPRQLRNRLNPRAGEMMCADPTQQPRTHQDRRHRCPWPRPFRLRKAPRADPAARRGRQEPA